MSLGVDDDFALSEDCSEEIEAAAAMTASMEFDDDAAA